jgi:membrane protein implicated in regulation of membrane protease activity
MAIFWIIVAVIMAVIEGVTLGLVTIWFTIGGAAAAVSALLGADAPIQVVVFFIVSIVLLIFTRPILVKKLKVGREKNVIEQLEGKVGLVTEDIRPFHSGLVKVNGIIWTAVGETNEVIAAAGTKVEILRVEGVKLIVRNPAAAGV